MQLFPISRKNRFRVSLLFLITVLSWETILSGFADELSQPILTKTVFLNGEFFGPGEGTNVIEPKAIISTPDGGYILAGCSIGAWTTKLDSQGKELWTYTYSLPKGVQGNGLLAFTGAALAPDGSLFLCGNAPQSLADPKADNGPTSFFTHLDVSGKFISRTFITPKNSKPHDLIRVDCCVAWNNGVAIMGIITRRLPPTAARPVNKQRLYYVLMLDAKSNELWEKEIPVSVRFGGSVSQPTIGKDNCLYFSMTDSVQSDIIKINSEGELLAQKQLPYQVRFVLPITNDGLLQLFGPKIDGNKSGLITLNQNLEEVGRITGNPEGDFFPYMAYRLPDTSLFLFGEGVHLIGRKYRAEAMHLDSSLKQEKRLELESKHFLNFGRVWIATPSSNGIGFLAPVKAASLQIEDSTSLHGALLNFISIK